MTIASPRRPTVAPLCISAVLLALVALLPGGSAPATASPASTTGAAVEVPVAVERVKPLSEREPMLRFLRDNRDFLRGRSDALRARPAPRSGAAAALDPRLVDYPALREAAARERDLTLAASDSLARRALLERIEELVAFESELTRLEARFGAAGERMARLERDFGGTPATALVLLLRGLPEAPPDSVIVRNDDGERWALALTGETAIGLGNGGLARVLHEFVEPRGQWLELSFTGAGWESRPAEYLLFEAPRDRTTVLEVDLRAARVAPDAPPLPARGWIDEPLLGARSEAGR